MAGELRAPEAGFPAFFHWDTDGMTSFALVRRVLNPQAEPRVPPLANFTPDPIVEELSKEKTVAVLDYGVSLPSSIPDAATRGKLIAVDHHRTQYPPWVASACNPVALEGASEKEFPSTTWVIWKRLLNERSGDPHDRVLVALGIVGDLGERTASTPVGRWALRILEEQGLELNGALELIGLLDSCYKTVDRDCVVKTALRLASEDPLSLRKDPRLTEKALEVERVVGEFTSQPPMVTLQCGVRSVGFWVHKSRLYVTSSLGRGLASKRFVDVVVLVDFVDSVGKRFVYVRSPILPVGSWLVPRLRDGGLNAGGKDSVAVAECGDIGCVRIALLTVLEVFKKELGQCSRDPASLMENLLGMVV